jgi:hypothetical protein
MLLYTLCVCIYAQLFAHLEAEQHRKEKKNSTITTPRGGKDKGFDEMNGVAAR